MAIRRIAAVLGGTVALVALLGFAMVLAGFTSVPFDAPRGESHATDFPKRDLRASELNRQLQAHPGETAIVALTDGNDSLGARLQMIDAAQQSIDMQYFLLKPDLAGGLIALAILEAADRGVRVRFLLDDALTTAKDRQIALLDAHPNIELRMFNPLSRKAPTVLNYIADFGRVNRRMHNKSMTVDRQFGIVGGRNLADEYFRVDTTSEFADFDVFLAGPVVDDIGAQFDLYWNDPYSVPLKALDNGQISEEDAAATIADMRTREEIAFRDLYRRAIDSSYLADIHSGAIALDFADIRVSHDNPDKLKFPVNHGERRLAEDLLAAMREAEKEVILLTPYFVPEDWGAAFFVDLAKRGIRVRIVTNSLASTNHAYVHAGYKRHRANLLAAGVELHEIRADVLSLDPDTPGAPSLTMHTKFAVIDAKTVFVGSLNFDPRSIKINTEFGIFVDDRELGQRAQDWLETGLPEMTYAVQLDERGDLVWRFDNGTTSETANRDPGAGVFRRMVANITGLLPVEGQL